jgi:hypothetical protein
MMQVILVQAYNVNITVRFWFCSPDKTPFVKWSSLFGYCLAFFSFNAKSVAQWCLSVSLPSINCCVFKFAFKMVWRKRVRMQNSKSDCKRPRGRWKEDFETGTGLNRLFLKYYLLHSAQDTDFMCALSPWLISIVIVSAPVWGICHELNSFASQIS